MLSSRDLIPIKNLFGAARTTAGFAVACVHLLHFKKFEAIGCRSYKRSIKIILISD